MTDPLESFGDEMQSWELGEQFRTTLADEARTLQSEHPGAIAVGLVLQREAPEAAPFVAALEQGYGKSIDIPLITSLVPRQFALEILRQTAPHTVEHLPESLPGERLPVVIALERGLRFASVPLVE